MIKKLRRKFVLIAAVSLFVVEFVIVGTINIINHYNINKSADDVIDVLVENGGGFPELRMIEPPQPDDMNGENRPEDFENSTEQRNESDYRSKTDYHMKDDFKSKNLNEETRYKTRYFVVYFNEENEEITKVDTGHIAAVTSDQAITYAKEIIAADKENGYSDIYKYRVADSENGKMIVFVDCRTELTTAGNFLLISIIIGLGAFLIVLLLIIIFSKRAVKPVIENMEKQKQFITDAGHELKTPLAIISANTEVIELTSEPNEWTESIKNQVTRLSELIKDLLNMARAEGASSNMTFIDFDVSNAVTETAEPFRTLAETNGKQIELDIDSGLRYYGDEASIKQLVSVLTENAVKYADEGGSIQVFLKPEGKGIRLSVKNPCAVPPKHPERLFDRFYRDDSSHSRQDGEKKGGYGIGLSVAASIVEAHKGRINCHAKNGYISFNAHLGKVAKQSTKKSKKAKNS